MGKLTSKSTCGSCNGTVMDVREQVLNCIGDYFMADGELDQKIFLVEDLGADSLDLLQLTQILNERFYIEIGADVFPQMLTVGGICGVVSQLRDESGSA